MSQDIDVAEQFERHLVAPRQSWLLGAGISHIAGVPLMFPLTTRVLAVALSAEYFGADEEAKHVIEFIKNDVRPDAHIEDLLTHLGDLIAIAERSRTFSAACGSRLVVKQKLTEVHLTLLRIISDTVRWGYRAPGRDPITEEALDAECGQRGKSIVTIEDHRAFIKAVFGSGRAGLDDLRPPVDFFTTNYDTLLEDALALEQVTYHDGFIGGAVAFWRSAGPLASANQRATVTKLHGSIDWFRPTGSPAPLLRVRDGETYPGSGGTVMIYPQATKYSHTQQDPFAELFQRFRTQLRQGGDQVLLICGSSFGDEHINAEIDLAMSAARSQLTLVAFAEERNDKLPLTLDHWRNKREWRKRVFIASSKGLYQGDQGPYFVPKSGLRDWWTFSGVARLLSDGLPNDVRELTQ